MPDEPEASGSDAPSTPGQHPVDSCDKLSEPSGQLEARMAEPTYSTPPAEGRFGKWGAIAGIGAFVLALFIASIMLAFFFGRQQVSATASGWKSDFEAADELVQVREKEIKEERVKTASLQRQLVAERAKRTDSEVRSENRALLKEIEALKTGLAAAEMRIAALERKNDVLAKQAQHLGCGKEPTTRTSPWLTALSAVCVAVGSGWLFALSIRKRINRLRAQEWNERGMELGQLGHHEEALVWISRATDASPRFAEAWSNKGAALDTLGRTEEALAACDRAIEINPNYADAWYNKGATLATLCRTEEALAACDRAIEISPEHADVWYNKGVALGRLGRTEEALAAYSRAIRLRPDDADAWYNKGVVLGNLGRAEEALVAYEHALGISPDFAAAWCNKSAVLETLRRPKEALAASGRAIEIRPDYETAWYNRGVALHALGRTDEALDVYDSAIKINPRHRKAWYNRACMRALLSQPKESVLHDLAEAIRLDPKCKAIASEDDDFASLRDDADFDALVSDESPGAA